MSELYGGMDEHCPYCGAIPFEHCAPDCLERAEPLDPEQAQQFTEQDEAAWLEVVADLA